MWYYKRIIKFRNNNIIQELYQVYITKSQEIKISLGDDFFMSIKILNTE